MRLAWFCIGFLVASAIWWLIKYCQYVIKREYLRDRAEQFIKEIDNA